MESFAFFTSLFEVLAFFALLSAILYGLGLLRGIYEKKQLLKIPPADLQEPFWVCIPARNEIKRLPNTVKNLLKHENKNLRIFVADDGSTDGTAEWIKTHASRDPRLQLFQAQSQIPGKPGTLAALVSHLESSKTLPPTALLFLDADMTVDVKLLGGLHHLLNQGPYDALSGAPHLICQTFSEKLMVPAFAALAAALYPPSKVHQRKKAFLNGQLIYIRREALSAVGGWDSVAHEILEDVALAQCLKRKHLSIGLVDLSAHVTTRMYTSTREIVNGFSKNVIPLCGGLFPAVVLALTGIILTNTPLLFLWAALLQKTGLLGAFLYLGLSHTFQGLTRKVWGLSAWPAFLSPITSIIFALILLKSIYHMVLRRPQFWRGRQFYS